MARVRLLSGGNAEVNEIPREIDVIAQLVESVDFLLLTMYDTGTPDMQRSKTGYYGRS